MMKAKNIAAVLTAAALTTAFAVPAFAATPGVEDTTYEKSEIAGGAFETSTDIKATVHAPGAKIIKVTVPSQLPIGIATKLGSGSTHVIDADKTLPVQAEVQNYSQDSAVNVSVAKVADDSNLLEKITLSLAPTTTMGTAGSTYSLVKGDSLNQALFTNLAGTTDGATNPGIGSLTLSASANASEDLTSLEGSHTVTAVLKVAVPTA